MDNIILMIAIAAPPVILAITLHEAAHGYVARIFGDPTAHEAGRITLNPIKHVDPVGTLLIPGGIVVMGALTGAALPVFGWAKPVPVNFGRLRHPKRDMLWVAAAGPGSNFVQAIGWAIAGGLFAGSQAETAPYWALMSQVGVQANLVLMLLNLLPVPPLDGGRIAVSLLPMRQAIALSRMEPYGFFILIALLFTGVLEKIMNFLIPPLRSFLHMLTGA